MYAFGIKRLDDEARRLMMQFEVLKTPEIQVLCRYSTVLAHKSAHVLVLISISASINPAWIVYTIERIIRSFQDFIDTRADTNRRRKRYYYGTFETLCADL